MSDAPDDWLAERFAFQPPLARLMDRRVVAFDRSGTVDVRFTAPEDFTNSRASIQGGILAAMLDSAVGMAVVATLAREETTATVEMKVSYFRPAKPGEFFAKGRVVQRGATLAHTEADLHDAEGTHIARATATLRIFQPR